MRRMKRTQWLATTAAMMLAAGAASAASITVNSISEPGFGSADLDLDNDFTRIQSALNQANGGDVITLTGTFDLSESNANADYVAATKRFTVPNFTGVTVVGSGAGATIRIDPDQTETAVQDQFGFFFNGRTGWTFDNLNMEGFEVAFRFDNNVTNFIIQNCTIKMENYSGMTRGISARNGAAAKGLQLLNNEFVFVMNSSVAGSYGAGQWMYGFLISCCSTPTGYTSVLDGNVFRHEFDPLKPQESTVLTVAIFDNNNTNGGAAANGTMSITNNVFDGGTLVGGNTVVTGYYALITTFRNDVFAAVPNTGYLTLQGNTFKDYPIVFNYFNPDQTPESKIVFQDTTFEDVGYYSGTTPLNIGTYASNYLPAIENATASVYGTNGGSPVEFDLDTQYIKNGVTYTGIPFLNAVALEPTFFEMQVVDLEAGVFAQAGILAATVTDVPATVYNRTADDEWTYEDRWVRPTPEEADGPTDVSAEELAFGYNCFGNAIPAGDVNVIANNPDPSDPLIIELTADTEYAPGTIINRNVIIRTDPSLTKGGAPAGAVKISPTIKKLTSPLFLLSPGFSLTLENVVLDGDSPFNGVSDVAGVVEALPASGALFATVTLDNVTVQNFFGNAVDAGTDAVVTITGSKFLNVGRVAYLDKTTNSTISGNFFQGASDGIVWAGANDASTVSRNVFNAVSSDYYMVGNAADLNIGLPGAGNLYFGGEFVGHNGSAYANPALVDFDIINNWNDRVFASGANDASGYVVGNLPVYQSRSGYGQPLNIVAGSATFDPPVTGPGIFIETQIIAQFDRDLDAWPDAWELGSGVTDYNVFDTDNDGWPDGVEAALGTNPNDNASFPAGTFDINADGDANGIADWYEEAFAANIGVPVFLGDVLGNDGQAGLQDAVRSLQIVNGAFGTKDLSDGNLHALDVTGLGVSSLGNPLQILRYQAGVRNKLPALAGID